MKAGVFPSRVCVIASEILPPVEVPHDEVEHVGDGLAKHALERHQHGHGDDAADATAIDGEDGEEGFVVAHGDLLSGTGRVEERPDVRGL